jgi:hypothetical protein
MICRHAILNAPKMKSGLQTGDGVDFAITNPALRNFHHKCDGGNVSFIRQRISQRFMS